MMDPSSVDLESYLNLNDPELADLYADALHAEARTVPPTTDVDIYLRWMLRNSKLMTVRPGAVHLLVQALSLRASGAFTQEVPAVEVEAPADDRPPPRLDALSILRDGTHESVRKVKKMDDTTGTPGA